MIKIYDWAKWYQRRCPARLNQKFLAYNGRCDLVRGHDGDEHARELGLEVVTFKMVWERKLSDMGELMVEQRLRERERQL